MFIWDYILTFRMEIDLVWKSKWNFMKGLYIFQRYSPFLDAIFRALYYHMEGRLTKNTCRTLYYAIGVTTMAGLAASEMLLGLRTWAVWNRNRRLSIILSILYILLWGSCLVVGVIYLNSNEFVILSKRCFVMHDLNNYLLFAWVFVIIWEGQMLILMLVPAIRVSYRQSSNSALMKAVYHDGIIYYLWLLALCVMNIFLVKMLPHYYRHLLTAVERVFHSMLASRVLLDIRAAGKGHGPADGLTELTQIRFHHRSEM